MTVERDLEELVFEAQKRSDEANGIVSKRWMAKRSGTTSLYLADKYCRG